MKRISNLPTIPTSFRILFPVSFRKLKDLMFADFDFSSLVSLKRCLRLLYESLPYPNGRVAIEIRI